MGITNIFHFDWIISQVWSDLIFINYRVDKNLIQSRLPKGLEVDTYEGDAFLSIVPFKMSKVRFPFTPYLPYSSLWELNIRTYVTCNGKRGIYFFTLDTNHFLAAWVAKTFFALPYRYTKLTGDIDQTKYQFMGNTFWIDAIRKQRRLKSPQMTWISERYSLFTQKNGSLLEGQAIHEPWKLRELEINKIDQTFLEEFGFHEYEFVSAYAGETLEVRFRPFQKVWDGR